LFFFPSPSPSEGLLRDFLPIPLFVPLCCVELKKEEGVGEKEERRKKRRGKRASMSKEKRRLQKGQVTIGENLYSFSCFAATPKLVQEIVRGKVPLSLCFAFILCIFNELEPHFLFLFPLFPRRLLFDFILLFLYFRRYLDRPALR